MSGEDVDLPVRAVEIDTNEAEDASGVTEVVLVRYRRASVVILTAMDGRQFCGSAVHYVPEFADALARESAGRNMRRLREQWDAAWKEGARE